VEVAEHYIREGYAITLVLRLINIPRSSHYYHKNGKVIEKTASGGRQKPRYSLRLDGVKVPDAQIRERIMELVSADDHAYGYRKLTVALRRDYDLIINQKKVYRLYRELNVLRPQRKVNSSYPRKLARNRIITNSNQLFETDIKYGYFAEQDRFFFIQSCLDVYDRSVVAYHIGLRCETQDVIRRLQTALLKRQLFEAQTKPVNTQSPHFVSAFEFSPSPSIRLISFLKIGSFFVAHS
jgi:putative transposase